MTPKEIANARQFLLKNQIPLDQVSPELLAQAARETNLSFTLLMRLIGRLLNTGQGMGGAPIARGIAETKSLATAARHRI